MDNSSHRSDGPLSVLVSAGTDHHPFDRLMRWTSSWVEAATNRGASPVVFAQRGTSQAPSSIRSADLVEHGELITAMRRAALVVCHGGPATIMDARANGHVPIVVPRLRRFGEHVDDHQLLFSRTMAERGQIALAETEDDLHRLLDAGLAEPIAFRLERRGSDLQDTVDSFEQTVAKTLEEAGRRRGETLNVMFVCSTGGHLAQLYQLERWWRQHDRSWVTFDKAHAHSLLRNERVIWAHHPTTRNPVNLMRNLLLARRVLHDARPDLILSNGAGVAVPFFVVGRALGIPTAYVEVYDRIDVPTLTGRLCAPFTSTFMVQWPEQQRLYRNAVLVGRLL